MLFWHLNCLNIITYCNCSTDNKPIKLYFKYNMYRVYHLIEGPVKKKGKAVTQEKRLD